MHCNKRGQSETDGVRVEVRVDVARIVKYTCLAGIGIVGIIFGTRAWVKTLEFRKKDF